MVCFVEWKPHSWLSLCFYISTRLCRSFQDPLQMHSQPRRGQESSIASLFCSATEAVKMEGLFILVVDCWYFSSFGTNNKRPKFSFGPCRRQLHQRNRIGVHAIIFCVHTHLKFLLGHTTRVFISPALYIVFGQNDLIIIFCLVANQVGNWDEFIF